MAKKKKLVKGVSKLIKTKQTPWPADAIVYHRLVGQLDENMLAGVEENNL